MGYAFGHRFLHKLAEAVQQGDRAIRFGGEIVSFPWFRNHVYQGMFPKGWVEGMGQTPIEQGRHMSGDRGPEPLKDQPGYL